jgi:hypothetical protein
MQTETPTLPDKLSDLITVALADLRACETASDWAGSTEKFSP